ncbi:hypothetical protein [Campylobacter mucosalis]|uniref:Uncharacterized protein n=1 Tax=Campylobacter mucosalis CCUG 21559 TaxID=1032067 RepID=A0A6G5QDZ0_9BACT|nr:hypothetical protein [Campylobacter mucosalis]QCD43913.1 hypothetical protein CMUC_0088 [Campylobacter mucosalis CCUG 21559]
MKIDSYNINMYSNHFLYNATSDTLGNSSESASLNIENSTFSGGKSSHTPTTNKISQNLDDLVSEPEKMMMIAKMAQEAIDMLKGIKKEQNSELISFNTDPFLVTQKRSESENLKLQTTGIIKAGSKEINVLIDINLSKSFQEISQIKVEPRFIDPLVITLDGNMPKVLEDRFEFDIDSDGEIDQISRLGANSGFLALDKNGDGKINNGSELFGANSGNGFADLSRYDDDKNGWIDENDKIFNKLRIWHKSGDNERLVALGEVGIGAIFLGSTSSEFSLKDSQNNELAQLKRSGFFLYENGKSGIVAQMDFVKFQNKDESDESLVGVKIEGGAQVRNEDRKDKSLLDILKQRLAALQSQLNGADPQTAATLQIQIASINAQIVALMSSGLA